MRAVTIERCAKVADGSKTNAGAYIAVAIRALAQKEAGASAAKPDDVPGDGVLPK